MKAQIGVRLSNILNGYLNLDAAAKPEDNDGRILANPTDLHLILDNNELEEFLVNDILDYLPLQARQHTITHFVGKLAHSGILIIMGIDIQEVSRLIHLGQLDVMGANQLVYGMGKKSATVPQVNVELALATGQMELDKISYNGPYFTIILKRK